MLTSITALPATSVASAGLRRVSAPGPDGRGAPISRTLDGQLAGRSWCCSGARFNASGTDTRSGRALPSPQAQDSVPPVGVVAWRTQTTVREASETT